MINSRHNLFPSNSSVNLWEKQFFDFVILFGHFTNFKSKIKQNLFSRQKPCHLSFKELESDEMQNPSKTLGHDMRDKENDSVEVQIPNQTEDQIITKRSTLNMFGSI